MITKTTDWPADLDARAAADMRREAKFAWMRRRQRRKRPRHKAARIWQAVREAYQARRCFLCGAFGRCDHRETDVEIARIEAGI